MHLSKTLTYTIKALTINAFTALCFLLFYPQLLFAQVLEFEQNPPKLKWREIRSEDFQLIYPQEMEETAQKLASQLEYLVDQVGKTFEMKPKKTTIILQNQSVISNGFVQMGPRKSEFVTTPSQDAEMNDWLENLAIHELRHIVQMDKLVGYLKRPFFEQLGFALYGLTLPSWFFEGDAVWTETEMTEGGRGRIPSWSMPLRANLLENRNYSYQKNYMGSYKDVTPGFYELGYHMVAKMRRDYPLSTYRELMNSLRQNPIRPFNLSWNWKKLTGHNTNSWHNATMEELRAAWKREQENRDWHTYSRLTNEESRLPFNEILPLPTEDGKTIYLQYGGQHATQLRMLDPFSRETSKILELGWQSNLHYNYDGGWLVWDELRKNPRYNQQIFQVIMTHNLKTGKTKQFTRKSRYFSPAVHAEKQIIAAIEIDQSNQFFLVLLDMTNGNVIYKVPAPGGITWQNPSFHRSGEKVIMTGASAKGMCLFEVGIKDADDFKVVQTTDWIRQKLERPRYQNDDIIFKAHLDGIDNLYRREAGSGHIFQLTQAQYGVFDPSYDSIGNRILMSQYHGDGYRLASLDSGLSLARAVAWDVRTSPDHFIAHKPMESSLSVFNADSILALGKEWESRPYAWSRKVINFHSLSVIAGEIGDLLNQSLGVFWLSDDKMNNVRTRLGYTYNTELHSSVYSTSLSVQRYFAAFNFGYQNRPKIGAFKNDSAEDPAHHRDSVIFGKWREHYAYMQVSVPVSFYIRNSYINTGIQARTSFTDRYRLDQKELANRFVDQIRFPMEYSFYFTHNWKSAPLDLVPRFGYHLQIGYMHLPFRNVIDGEHLSFRARLYLPGLLRNHATILRFNTQDGWGTYRASDHIPMVSGYAQLRPSVVYNNLLTSYLMPIAYPDWTLGPVAYVKRIYGGFFADFENVSFHGKFAPRTVGLDLRMGLNLFRYFLPEIELNGKLIYINDPHARGDRPNAPKWLYSYGFSYSY